MNENLAKRALRYLVEQPLEDPTVEPEIGADVGEEEQKIEIFFSNLDEAMQKKVMDALLKATESTPDDVMARKKITEQLSKKPMFIVVGDELKRQMNIDI